MLHTPMFGRAVPTPPLAPAVARRDLTPAVYVKVRRQAADRSIVEVAQLLAVKADDQAEIRALVRMLETPGITARARGTIELLARAFPIDPDVYQQLATLPADQHPMICRGCGCSQNDACVREEIGACAWAGPSICTACTDGESF